MKEKYFLLDMDGVLTDTIGGYIIEWAKKFPHLPKLEYQNIKLWNIEKNWPWLNKKLFEEVWETRGFFYNLKPLPGALEALNTLIRYVDVRICTSPMTKNETCLQEKWDWIKKYCGKEYLDRLITTKDKTFITGDILIDDEPIIRGKKCPIWEHILYSHPWNEHIKEKRRLTWENYKEILGII